jgi:hypothetical protein
MAPHRQWCYTEKKGTHWYVGPTEEYAWLYQFVRKSARLLDGYEAVAQVAVVYDNAARKQWRGDIQPVCTALAERNIPSTVAVAGDDWLDYRLDAGRLGSYKAVIVTKDLGMDSGQRELIEKVRAEGRLVVCPDEARLEKLLPTPVQIERMDQVAVVVRAIPGDNRAPLAVHLLNRRYDQTKDAMVPMAGFDLRLRQDILGGRRITGAMLHSPRYEPIPTEVRNDNDSVVIKVPGLDLWTIVELSDKPN